MSMAVSIGAESVSIYKDGDFYQVDKSHGNYQMLVRELRKVPRDEVAIMELLDIPRFVASVTAGRVAINKDAILFKGDPVSGYMVDKLLAMINAGDDVESWALFMDNLFDNPNPGVREDLYQWMEAGKLPITPDGCIIGFKKVRADYTDVHTGRFSNLPGSVLEMPRDQCDPSRNNTCSTGFHFCSAGYLSSFSGQKVVVVKINPRDVTAIPSDYNNQKARCCRYVVTGELSSESSARHKVWNEKNVVNLEDPRELPEVMLPRKGATPKDIVPDPARAEGPPPVDDLLVDADLATPAPAKAVKKPRKVAGKKRAAAKKPKAVAQAPEGKSLGEILGGPLVVEMQAATAPEPVFKSRGLEFSARQVADALEGSKYSEAAKVLGVPESTLKGWAKKL